jgi:hypothetical protein
MYGPGNNDEVVQSPSFSTASHTAPATAIVNHSDWDLALLAGRSGFPWRGKFTDMKFRNTS